MTNECTALVTGASRGLGLETSRQLERRGMRVIATSRNDARHPLDVTEAGWPSSAYSVSKVGLNALTRILARELEPRRIRVNAVCPGWVRTDMGGRHAERDVATGAASIVWAAVLEEGGPTGGFFRDGERIPW